MEPKVAKIFMNGRSQAVRLPKEFRFATAEVLIRKEGDEIILSPRPTSWEAFFKDTPQPSQDFMATRPDLPPQVREDLF
ncbi:MAG: AbrB/MazE/SpoVT family DNA-binding domain-containing protein [Candidatus Latescibacteria bacterium]|nr:AbrB/MazE/SpoVT family DNA-binding domain-containing protein [Candidatus Latescibacterota bacterium]